MTAPSSENSGAFIRTWLEAKKGEAGFDHEIMTLIEKNLGSNGLRETRLLNDLIAYSKRLRDSHGSD